MSQKNRNVSLAALIAALYVVLTFLSNAFGMASGMIQVRISEALCILPIFTPWAIPGLTLGCFFSNLLTGCALPDIIFGTFATLMGAVGTYYLRSYRFLSPLPPIVANTVIIPFVLRYAYHLTEALPFMMLTVGAGEVISCGVLGIALMLAITPMKDRLFPSDQGRPT